MKNKTGTGFCILWGLVFSFLLVRCSGKAGNPRISILWEDDQAKAVSIPPEWMSGIPNDSVEYLLHIHLSGKEVPVLGEYFFEGGETIFRPLISFTRGLKYEIYFRNRLMDKFEIPSSDPDNAPEIVAVYPSSDTLPENLLKFYILFSRPMKEGDALKQIHLVKNGNDTLASVFLDLQQELWNHERTMLTLWLDPGRIKRDLQPNKNLGPPLLPGEHYQLLISKDWQGADGMFLKNGFQKNFFTTIRDSISPDTRLWTFDLPAAGTIQQLQIRFHESLDHVLAENTMRIRNGAGKEIRGTFTADPTGTTISFSPAREWTKGTYTLETESRLEDLSGNNLNRLFDADLTRDKPVRHDVYKRSFEIQ